MDAEEEDYFNGSDEEEVPWVASTNLKRKRNGRAGISSSGSRPSRSMAVGGMTLPSPYPSPLVDYPDDEDESGLASPSELPMGSLLGPSLMNMNSGSQGKGATSNGMDALLEDLKHSPLSDSSGPRTPDSDSGSSASSGRQPSPPGDLPGLQKRRRDEDDDEMMQLLASKSKRPSFGSGEKPNANVGVDNEKEGKESTPGTTKKIKLSLGKAGFGIASSVLAGPKAIVMDKQDGDGG